MSMPSLDERVHALEIKNAKWLGIQNAVAALGLTSLIASGGLFAWAWATARKTVAAASEAKEAASSASRIIADEATSAAHQALRSIGVPFIQLGSVQLGTEQSVPTATGDATIIAHDGKMTKRPYGLTMQFSKQFEGQPRVVVSLIGFNLFGNETKRREVFVDASQISPEGMRIQIDADEDQSSVAARIAWLAVGYDKTIASPSKN